MLSMEVTKEYIDNKVSESVLTQTNSRFTALIVHIAILSLVTAIFFFISNSNKTELKEDIRDLKTDIRDIKIALKIQ